MFTLLEAQRFITQIFCWKLSIVWRVFDIHSAAEVVCTYVIIHSQDDKPTACVSSNFCLPEYWRVTTFQNAASCRHTPDTAPLSINRPIPCYTLRLFAWWLCKCRNMYILCHLINKPRWLRCASVWITQTLRNITHNISSKCMLIKLKKFSSSFVI
jgi:hypothetical protein